MVKEVIFFNRKEEKKLYIFENLNIQCITKESKSIIILINTIVDSNINSKGDTIRALRC